MVGWGRGPGWARPHLQQLRLRVDQRDAQLVGNPEAEHRGAVVLDRGRAAIGPAEALEHVGGESTAQIVRERLPVGIFELTSGSFLGNSGLERVDWQLRRFEIGYWLRAGAQGRGYIHEAVRLLTALAFRELAAKRVQIRMDPRNERSER